VWTVPDVECCDNVRGGEEMEANVRADIIGTWKPSPGRNSDDDERGHTIYKLESAKATDKHTNLHPFPSLMLFETAPCLWGVLCVWSGVTLDDEHGKDARGFEEKRAARSSRALLD